MTDLRRDAANQNEANLNPGELPPPNAAKSEPEPVSAPDAADILAPDPGADEPEDPVDQVLIHVASPEPVSAVQKIRSAPNGTKLRMLLLALVVIYVTLEILNASIDLFGGGNHGFLTVVPAAAPETDK
jgi:hypothetical protein